MTVEQVAREWVERRERVWARVRSDSRSGPCWDAGGECVCHISSARKRRCVVCNKPLLGEVAEGAYVDRDAAGTALAALVTAGGGPCWSYPTGRCAIGSPSQLAGGKTATCSRCGCEFKMTGALVEPIWPPEKAIA